MSQQSTNQETQRKTSVLRLSGQLTWIELYQRWEANNHQPVTLVSFPTKNFAKSKAPLSASTNADTQQQLKELTSNIPDSLPLEEAQLQPVQSVDRHQNDRSVNHNLSAWIKNWKLPTITLSKPSVHLNIPFVNTNLDWPQLISNFMISTAVALFLLFGSPIVILESQSLVSKARDFFVVPRSQNIDPLSQIINLTPATPRPKIKSAEDVFAISIPTLDIESAVVPNVDVTDNADYNAALKQGVAHALGTALPDQMENNKTIYLFAHSTDSPWNILRYNAQFYALKDIQTGTEINIRFWGKDYSYQVEQIKIVNPDDVTALVPQTNREQLILQTCYPPGTTQKRLLVIATPSAQLE